MSPSRVRALVSLPLTMLFVTLLSPVFVLVRLLLGRRAAAEGLGAFAASAILRFHGVEIDMQCEPPRDERQRVYISNHTSSLDVFVLLALGLPRARFFMKRGAWVFPPGALVALSVGTFFTVPQTHTDKRRALFAAACEVLRRTGDSVYLSPEGTRVVSGGVGPFNKGAFHLAAALRAPIVPLHLAIPKHENPGKSWVMTKTRVTVRALPEIDTSEWDPARARELADDVRRIYLDFEAERAA